MYSKDSCNNREEYFYTNNLKLSKKQVIEGIISRWPIETLFEESKQHLKIGGLKGYCQRSILTTVPACFIMMSIIVLLFLNLPEEKQKPAIFWKGKEVITFTDMLTIVRREIWIQWIFKNPMSPKGFWKVNTKSMEFLINGLAPCD